MRNINRIGRWLLLAVAAIVLSASSGRAEPPGPGEGVVQSPAAGFIEDTDSLENALRTRLSAIRSGPGELHDSIAILRQTIDARPMTNSAKQVLLSIWLKYAEGRSSAWCSDAHSASSPYIVKQFSFDEAAWPTEQGGLAVEANTHSMWIYYEPHHARDRLIARTPSGVKELQIFPPLPVSNCNRHTPDGPPCGPLLPSLSRDWERWNSAWDEFEKLHRAHAWRAIMPFMTLKYPNYEHSPYAPLSLASNSAGTLNLIMDGVVLAAVRMVRESEYDGDLEESMRIVGLYQDSMDDDRKPWVVEAFYTGTSILVRYERTSFVFDTRIIQVQHPDAPQPVVFCAPNAKPLIRPPKWARPFMVEIESDTFIGERMADLRPSTSIALVLNQALTEPCNPDVGPRTS